MLFAEEEINIIEEFQFLQSNEVLLMPTNNSVESILQSVLNVEKWKLWTNSSGKADLPPDFFCDSLGLMMDVMRVDDHGFEKNGKIINPFLAKEHQIEKEIRATGIMDACPNAKLFINAVTDLPTKEDHNYVFYRDNFSRTLKKHLSNISNYKKNHPNHKLIFFVFDESSMYCQVEKPNMTIKSGEMFECTPHLWFLDKSFTDVFEKTEIDYLIWFAPYKRFEKIIPPLELPKACVFDNKDTLEKKIIYDATYMMSSEE